ncbi:ORF894 [White spot syndrome virus]|uniref:Wsv417 n=3 Tax=White spot syndrome virus TaxID=342409 RepID=Q8VAJ2_WSSVS|nr:wsv417 [Shrimp white spot syndrome virus]AFX59794.1 wsv417 [White spot syndrome virus]AAL33419.1 wsv417 [Shrimp white spot syndrome virus]AAL89344.1 WSSV476 [Shrimp white spot syndrome virus]ATU83850.1 ORF894 [White spot syndrome virus]AWQ60541.1 wsv417 [Shrimp white spot syndrome virus]
MCFSVFNSSPISTPVFIFISIFFSFAIILNSAPINPWTQFSQLIGKQFPFFCYLYIICLQNRHYNINIYPFWVLARIRS